MRKLNCEDVIKSNTKFVENVNLVLKGERITALSLKKVFMERREFGELVILYNLTKIVEEKSGVSIENQSLFLILQIESYVLLGKPIFR